MTGHVTLIKVGGSLLDWPELPRRLSEFLEGQRARWANQRFLLMAGGGAAADLVRRLDRDHGLDDETAHDLAIHAMDLSARLLAAVLPGSVAVERLADRFPAWREGRIPILTPSPVVREIERRASARLPRSWETTSDSIAAWIGGHLGTDSVVLLKSASLPAGADRRMAARLGRVDPNFVSVSENLSRVEYLNLREPGSGLLTLHRGHAET